MRATHTFTHELNLDEAIVRHSLIYLTETRIFRFFFSEDKTKTIIEIDDHKYIERFQPGNGKNRIENSEKKLQMKINN